MTTKRYCVMVIPAEHRLAANVLLAVVNGDNPLVSTTFSRGASADGSFIDPEDPYATATHFFGGMPVTEGWLDTVSNLSSSLVAPVGGYPFNGVTESAAQDAAEALHLQVTVTQDGTSPSPQATLANAMAALNIVPIVVE